MPATVLIVDDERNIRRTLRMVLEGAGLTVVEAETGEQGLQVVQENEPDMVILDVKLPKVDGLEVLRRIRRRPETVLLPVLMISGHASITEAVDAVQLGATDFFEKPLDRDRVLVSVRNALNTRQLQREVDRLRADVHHRYEMIGRSAVMTELFAQIEKVAPTNGRVLITGESGTGKELIARAIHRLSPRRENPFLKLNCAAIPSELIESELFGHERGAFTGAQQRKKGLFEIANGGTLLLDEIGDMSLSAQAKVLRALQSGEIHRVGSEQPVEVDVRVLAATNKNLEREVAEGRFREDLYFRLNVVPIRSPALRERAEDIPPLADTFLRDFCRENGLKQKPVAPEVWKALQQRSWPGNVRELKNIVERMVIMSGEHINLQDLPEASRAEVRFPEKTPSEAPSTENKQLNMPATSLREYRERAEREYILVTLENCEWNISRAAERLGVERTNLHKKMRAYGIRRSGRGPEDNEE